MKPTHLALVGGLAALIGGVATPVNADCIRINPSGAVHVDCPGRSLDVQLCNVGDTLSSYDHTQFSAYLAACCDNLCITTAEQFKNCMIGHGGWFCGSCP